MAKSSKNQKVDERDLQELVKSVWGNYSVPKQSLKNPTREFTNEFFAKCLNELKTVCFSMFKDIHEEKLGDVMSYCPANVDPEVFLYVHVKHIMDLINITYVALTDFYRPPNRTVVTMKVFLNFLLFAKRTVHKAVEIVQMVNGDLKVYSESVELLKRLKDELHDFYVKIGEGKEEIEDLKLREKKVIRMREEFENRRNMETIQVKEKEHEIEVEGLQLKELEEMIKSIDESNSELQAKTITEGEFKTTMETVERLREETKSLVEEDVQINAVDDQKDKNIQILRVIRTLLEPIDLTTWDCIPEIQNVEALISAANTKKAEFQRNIKHLNPGSERKEKDIINLKNEIKKEKDAVNKKRTEIENKRVKLENVYKMEMNNYAVLSDQEKATEENIKDLKLKHQETEMEIERIVNINSNAYKRVLEQYQKVSSTFEDTLMSIGKE